MAYFRAKILALIFLICVSNSQIVNVAVNKPTEQYNTLFWSNFSWTADKAVDNCILRNGPETQGCCSATIADQNPSENFWRVNLTREFDIKTIKVFGRTDQTIDDQLNGFDLYATSTSFVGPVSIVKNKTNNTDGIYIFNFEPSYSMDGIIVKRFIGIFLLICEVQMFAVCDSGYFGPNCTRRCGHCLSDEPCDVNDALCPSGCQSGWTGYMCDAPCNTGWGFNCSNPCGHCDNSQPCHHINGSCFGKCDAGWTGEPCVEECTSGTWGNNCSNRCGPCDKSYPCHHINGTCFRKCEAGWTGDVCVEKCASGTWGKNCISTCGNCRNSTKCNFANGSCPHGCQEGWHGAFCTECMERHDTPGNVTYNKDNISMFIGLYAVIGILAVISAVSVGMNSFLWKRRILTTKTEENIRPPAPHPVLISNEGTSYDELSIARSDTDVYLTITHEYENGGVHV